MATQMEWEHTFTNVGQPVESKPAYKTGSHLWLGLQILNILEFVAS